MEKEIDKETKIDMSMDRRTFVKLAGTTAAAIAFGGVGFSRLVQPANAASLTKFVDPLVIPPALIPDITTYPGTDYYKIPIVQGVTHKFHRDLPATKTYSYFGEPPANGFHYLGPTIIAKKGRPVKIKFTNSLPTGNHLLHDAVDTTIIGSLDKKGNPWTDENRVAIHLHGGKTRPEFDGGPRDWFSPVGSDQSNPYQDAATFGKMDNYTYEYSSDQSATLLWYHDHAWAITRFNPFCGMAAAYILRDDGEQALIDGTNGQTIPSGNYEVPIVLQDKLLDHITGAMIYPNIGISPSNHPKWIPEYFGDTPVVNGRAYPYLEVEPRRYRIRFLNGSNARFYNIFFATPTSNIPIWVIGSEQGFLPAPVVINKLLIAPGERFDTIVDFAGIPPGTNLILKNNAKAPYPSGVGLGVPQIMQFRVIAPTGIDNTTSANLLTLPPSLPAIPPADIPSVNSGREIVLQEKLDPLGNPIEVLLEGYHFVDSVNQNLFIENANSVNIWQFINTTGDAHPMHPHLVPFKILNRQPFDVAGFTIAWDAYLASNRTIPRPSINNPQFLTKGAAYGPAPEETGWKDTAKSYPGEVLRIVIKFVLPDGVPPGDYKYVCHCHILEHEENDMMFQYVVHK